MSVQYWYEIAFKIFTLSVNKISTWVSLWFLKVVVNTINTNNEQAHIGNS